MDAFTVHQGLVAPMDRENVDTDAIIPKQFLKSIARSGFGPNLFDAWRYLDPGEPGQDPASRRPNPDFVLNQPRYQPGTFGPEGASILLARSNFGCGSSREHAPWALEQYGFRALIAPSFADIFFNNCFKNGLLPIQLPESQVAKLFDEVLAFPGYRLTVDLPRQVVVKPDGDGTAVRGAAVPQVLPRQRLRRYRPDAAPRRQDQGLRGRAPGPHALAGANPAGLKETGMKIAILPGDGIGTEIVDQAVRVLKVLDLPFETETALVGGAAYEAHGHPLPDSTLKLAQAADAILFGAVGDWKYDKLERALRPEQAILGLRKHLGLFANLRPALCYEQLTHASSLKPELVAGLDILIIRELTGDIYFGQPRGRRTAIDGHFPGAEEAFDTMRYSRPEIERIAHVAFQAARKRSKQGDQRRQGQRAGDLPVLEGRRHRGPRAIPRRRAAAHVRRQRRHAAGEGAQGLRRGRHRQHVRRHPVSDEAAMLTGSHRHAAQRLAGQGQQGPVRAQPRQRARHRR